MSVNYFTGSNNVVGGGKNQSSDTGLTALGLAETEPVSGADGIDVKPNRTVDSATQSKYTRIRTKVYSKTGDTIGKGFENNVGCLGMKGGKGRVSHLKGKYELGKMWKYRKTLKRLWTSDGHAAYGAEIGERFTKGSGYFGAKKHSKPQNGDYVLFPIDETK